MKNRNGYIDPTSVFAFIMVATVVIMIGSLMWSIIPKNKQIKSQDVQNALNLCANGVESVEMDSYGGPSVHCK